MAHWAWRRWVPSPEVAVHSNQLPRLGALGGVRLRDDVAYTNFAGEEKSGIRKQTEQAAGKLGDVLTRLLERDEAVLYVLRAQAPLSAFEQLTLGWHAYSMTGAVLVFTNRRLLRFRVKNKGWHNWVWNRGVQTVRWGDVAEAKVKGWLTRSLQLRYRSGKKETYLRLRHRDAKKLRVLLAAILPGAAGEATPAQAIESLCPNCLATLRAGAYQCGQCGLTFKDEKSLLRRSVFLPGGGYFYVGWPTLGALNGLFEGFLLIVVVVWALVAFGVMAEPDPQPGRPPTTQAQALFVASFSAFLVALEKAIAFVHCRRHVREFIPTR